MSRHSRAACGGQAVGAVVEAVEPRILFNAAVTSPIADIQQTLPVASPTTIDLASHFDDPAVTGTVVQFHFTPDIGDVYVEMYDQLAPLTVANFLHHANEDLLPNSQTIHYSSYDETVIQRVLTGFIIQGGGYAFPGFTKTDAAGTDPTVPNEFAASHPNVAGTIAMAKLGGQPDSATNEFFFNIADNRSILDPQNGGFTTFGQTLYGGLNTLLNKIASLPRIDGGQVNSTFTELGQFGQVIPAFPVRNTDGQNSFPADANHVVILQSVRVVPELSYSVSSDNAALVNPSISNGQLTLDYGANKIGVAHVTVTATDVGGHQTSDTFAVNVLGNDVTLASGKKIKFLDADNSTVTVGLKGPGSATLSFPIPVDASAKVIPARTDLTKLTLDGTTSASSLTISVTKGTTALPAVQINGSIGSFSAAKANVTGAFDVTGTMHKFTIGNAGGPGTALTIDSAGDSLTFKASLLSDFSIASAQTVGSFTVKSWLDTDATPDTFDAPLLGKMKITTGNFAADVAITGTGAGGVSLTSLSVKKDVTGATVRAAGSIGSVTAGRLVDSAVYAGERDDLSGLPTATDATNTAAAIGKVTLKSLVDSFLGAPHLGKLKIGTMPSANDGVPFGVAADTIASVQGATDTAGKFKKKALDLSSDSLIVGDAEIVLY